MAYEYWTLTGSAYRRSEDPQGDIDAGLPVAMIGALRRRTSPSALAFVAEPGPLTGQTDWRPLAEAVVAARGVGSEQVVPLADFFATSRGAFVAPASAESAAEALRDRFRRHKWRGRLWCTRVGRLVSAAQALRPKQDFDSPAGLTLDHVVTVASITRCLDEEEAVGDLDAIRAV